MHTVRFLFLLVALLLANTNVNAMTNQSLYKWCKPYSDRAFNLTEDEDFYCRTYITGVWEYARFICDAMTNAAGKHKTADLTRSFFGASAEQTTDALIQLYVNKMKNDPEQWQYAPTAALREVFQEIAPCK